MVKVIYERSTRFSLPAVTVKITKNNRTSAVKDIILGEFPFEVVHETDSQIVMRQGFISDRSAVKTVARLYCELVRNMVDVEVEVL